MRMSRNSSVEWMASDHAWCARCATRSSSSKARRVTCTAADTDSKTGCIGSFVYLPFAAKASCPKAGSLKLQRGWNSMLTIAVRCFCTYVFCGKSSFKEFKVAANKDIWLAERFVASLLLTSAACRQNSHQFRSQDMTLPWQSATGT